MPRKVCVFTGSRAEYGLLAPLMREIQSDPSLILQLVASGGHLVGEFGNTWREIEGDNFFIDAKVDMALGSDAPVDLAESMALCLAGCAKQFDRLTPDILIVLGDRYEALAAAEAAMMLRIPIAHIHGGEATEGAMDDAIRHAITKLSHLHFAAAEVYRERIMQMGEAPERVYTVGAPGLDQIEGCSRVDRVELERDLGFRFRDHNLLVTLHPATLEHADQVAAMRDLLAALDRFPDLGIVFTKSNADVDGRKINTLIDRYTMDNVGRVVAVASLGHRRYLSVMGLVDAVVGNSSSGIIEAPAMGKPTVNIGSRQKGRARAPSVLDCAPFPDAIAAAITRALSPEMQAIAMRKESPYGKGNASAKIKEVLATVSLEGLLTKSFFRS
jgi:UDP-hydrolysing UDP-N-acetyl-D-glucosamine 2-epimerase